MSENADGNSSGSGLTTGGRMLGGGMSTRHLLQANHGRNDEHMRTGMDGDGVPESPSTSSKHLRGLRVQLWRLGIRLLLGRA
eukprot:3966545-Prorocentrum_lima.AAC.1